jgi:hypothetical protein
MSLFHHTKRVHLPEAMVEGKRLGRHVKHDPRSRHYGVDLLPGIETVGGLKAVSHVRRCGPFDQGQVGSCVGNAIVGCLMTEPTWKAPFVGNEVTAQVLYSQATHLDPVDGQSWPPNDVGSNGVDGAEMAKRRGWITSYLHAFSLNDTLRALQLRPVAIGSNWYDSFDNPDINGSISISPNAQSRGGHEYYLSGYDASQPMNRVVQAWNSWGEWGVGGRFYMSVATLSRLLSEQGDATIPVV